MSSLNKIKKDELLFNFKFKKGRFCLKVTFL